ncbi:MAG TPA: hypothetical protein VMY35_08705 [Phycisphaerae bacterium]|nr:hypothetical protein [Phycisphaerae bacterium]
MTTAAKKAFHTELQKGDAATPELFTTVAELVSIEPPEAVSGMTEVTSHDSAKGEHIATYVDEGELTARGNWTGAASQTAIRTAQGAAAGNWQICLPDWGQRTKTFTAATNDTITATAHGLTTGQPVQVSTTTTLPAGLSASTTYYALWLSANTFTLHTTNAGAVAGTGTVDITDTGTGTHTLQIGSRFSAAAVVTGYKLDAPLDAAQGIEFRIKVTGAATLTVD